MKVTKVNIEDSLAESQWYDAMSIPTLFMSGQVVDRLVGAVPEPQMDAFVRTVG